MMTPSNGTFSALLAFCAGNSPVPGEFSAQRPVTRSFDVFFDLHLNKQLSKQSWGWWFQTSSDSLWRQCNDGPLTRYVKLRVAHAPGMPGTFSPPPRISDPDIHHGACVTHVPWCMPGWLIKGFIWRWRGKRSRYSRRMRNPQFYVSSKRHIQRYSNLFVCLKESIYIPADCLLKLHALLLVCSVLCHIDLVS